MDSFYLTTLLIQFLPFCNFTWVLSIPSRIYFKGLLPCVVFHLFLLCILARKNQRQILLLALTHATKQLIQERAFSMHKTTKNLCFYQEIELEYMVEGCFTYPVWSKQKIQQ